MPVQLSAKGLCCVPSCTKKTKTPTGKVCSMHQERLRRTGTLELKPPKTTMERFMEKVAKSDDGCWIWTGSTVITGYGTFRYIPEETYTAHRSSYLLFIGPVPDGLQIDHLCRVRNCVNPAHLEAVTQQENLARGEGVAAINARKTHCIRGHEYTEENTYRSPGKPDHRQCRECIRLYSGKVKK